MEELSWKPARAGITYCSPACGRGCTHREYLQAKKDARKLAAAIGVGWKPHVWENLGWFYSAISPCGRIKVHHNRSDYTAFLGKPNCAGGPWAEHGPSAREAVVNVIAAAKHQLRELQASLEGL